MSTISFEYSGEKLILCYTPITGIDDITKRLDANDVVCIKHSFFVTNELLFEPDKEDNWENALRFCIGKVGDMYTRVNSEVIGTEHTFFFGNEIKLKPEMFVAYRNISILRKIDRLLERDFYVGGDWEKYNGISKEAFEELIKKFPKSTELDKYACKRIASIIKDSFPECDKYEAIFDKYIESKQNRPAPPEASVSQYNIQIELEQFTVAYNELSDMLKRYEAIDEKQWQTAIQNTLLLLYPKYICCAREIRFYGIGKHDKQPDFCWSMPTAL